MRLDKILLKNALVTSRAQAARAIENGYVMVDGAVVTKPATQVSEAQSVTINDPNAHYVSRGALKLLAIIGDVNGKVALDLGASTGGFTQVLLEHGARHVFAVDVGHGQLHESLRDDSRVSNQERVNVKTLSPESIDHPLWPEIDVITADLSFISLTKALPAALDLAGAGARLYALVKPQFELSPAEIGKGGIVKSSADRERALANVVSFLEARGWVVHETKQSPIAGGDGNIEFVLAARRA